MTRLSKSFILGLFICLICLPCQAETALVKTSAAAPTQVATKIFSRVETSSRQKFYKLKEKFDATKNKLHLFWQARTQRQKISCIVLSMGLLLASLARLTTRVSERNSPAILATESKGLAFFLPPTTEVGQLHSKAKFNFSCSNSAPIPQPARFTENRSFEPRVAWRSYSSRKSSAGRVAFSCSAKHLISPSIEVYSQAAQEPNSPAARTPVQPARQKELSVSFSTEHRAVPMRTSAASAAQQAQVRRESSARQRSLQSAAARAGSQGDRKALRTVRFALQQAQATRAVSCSQKPREGPLTEKKVPPKPLKPAIAPKALINPAQSAIVAETPTTCLEETHVAGLTAGLDRQSELSATTIATPGATDATTDIFAPAQPSPSNPFTDVRVLLDDRSAQAKLIRTHEARIQAFLSKAQTAADAKAVESLFWKLTENLQTAVAFLMTKPNGMGGLSSVDELKILNGIALAFGALPENLPPDTARHLGKKHQLRAFIAASISLAFSDASPVGRRQRSTPPPVLVARADLSSLTHEVSTPWFTPLD